MAVRRHARIEGAAQKPDAEAGPGSARCEGRESGPDLPPATHLVLIAGQLFDADRPARMHLPGRDPDLRPHPELAAIGELGRGVDQHDAAVDLVQEALRRSRGILGENAVGMVRAVAVDMRDGARNPIDDAGRDDGFEIFGRPVGLGGREHAQIDP